VCRFLHLILSCQEIEHKFMTNQRLGYLGTRAVQAILALLIASTLHADTTLTFRNGSNGYTGSTDVSINTQYAQYNGGNGIPGFTS